MNRTCAEARHVRPIAGEQLPQSLRVRFPKALRFAHPLGTNFLVYAKLTNKEGGNDFVHTNHAWGVEVLGMPETYNREDYY